MFTLHFILLLGFSTLEIDATENTDPKLINLQNDSGITSIRDRSLTPSLTQPLENEFNENYEDYEGREFQDNRLRLMLQPKKPLTLNETQLRTWPSNPNVSKNASIISYRNAFAVLSPEETEISRNEITENMSKTNKKVISNDYEIVTNFPITNSTSGETFGTGIGSKPNEKKILPKDEDEKAKFEANSRHLEVDLTDVTEDKISNVTVVTGKFVASLPSSKNASSPIQNETSNNGAMNEESTLARRPETQNISNDTIETSSEQEEGIGPLITNSIESQDKNVKEPTHPPSNLTNQTQDLENDNVYEELEPDNLSEENYTDYITPNETTIDETNTVVIVLPGSDPKIGNNLTETGTVAGKPYISEAISQNLLYLLMNLTAVTGLNERNEKKILRELQEQKRQLQGLRKQSDNIYSYITTGKMVNQMKNGQKK